MDSNTLSVKAALCRLLLIIAMMSIAQSTSAEPAPKLSIKNYVRAVTDFQMRSYVENLHCFGKFFHMRDAYDVNSKITVRPNRDTIYSWGVFNLSSPLSIGRPDPKDGYQSLMVVNQDYSIWAEYGPKDVTFTEDNVGTRYLCWAAA